MFTILTRQVLAIGEQCGGQVVVGFVRSFRDEDEARRLRAEFEGRR